jgi:FkbM family methyltransferase
MLPTVFKALRSVAKKLIERATNSYVVPKTHAWQLQEREYLKQLFSWARVDCVFDVGANAGQYADMLRRQIGFKGPIISFEPLPELAAELRNHARSDPFWFIEGVALSDKSGERTFNVTVENQASSLHKLNAQIADTLFDNFVVARQCQVRTEMLSSVYSAYARRLNFQRPFLKMDTQGHDLAVVAGAGAALEHFVGLQSELAVIPLYEATPDYKTALSVLEDAGFALGAIVPNNDHFFPRLFEFDCIMISRRLLELTHKH